MQLLFSPSTSLAESADAVRVIDAPGTVTLENGVVSVAIEKLSARVLRIRYKGLDLVDSSGPASYTGGYWNVLGEVPGGTRTQNTGSASAMSITQDPSRNGGELGEVEISFPYRSGSSDEPLDITIRYTLRRGDSGVYAWTSLTHRPEYPAFDIVLGLVTFKLNPALFDHMTIDRRRDRNMISASDWFHGEKLNVAEARRMTTGIHKGEVEHKYDYSAMFSETPAYGWTSTKKNVGVWLVNPSIEYINGAPTKIELTAHMDIKEQLPLDPTLLFVWHGSHYGGLPVPLAAGEAWNKVVGPFLIYCNSGTTPDAMWQDALARAKTEQAAWPYAWARAPGYAGAAERGTVTGRLTVTDPQQPGASAAGAWVGLAAAPYTGIGEKKEPLPISWETDGKHYEFWTHADKSGAFAIRNARPGKYVLYAFNDGILGEFSRAEVSVEAGKTTDLGGLKWTPVRYGRQVWEIGVPDRSAAEFRHGDRYWQWGLYNQYPEEFPNDVNFVIGKGRIATDWNYVQPPRAGTDGRWHGTTWRIAFDMAAVPAGKGMLRLAICGARGNSVVVRLNGKAIGGSGKLPNSGVMHRDGIRGVETEVDLPFEGSLLLSGRNEIELTTTARDWTEGVLYDYLRLEVAE